MTDSQSPIPSAGWLFAIGHRYSREACRPCGVVQTTCLPLLQEITGLPRQSAQRVGGSEAGQGRQFHCPQSILSDALLWYGSQLGATPSVGSSLVAVRKHRSRAT